MIIKRHPKSILQLCSFLMLVLFTISSCKKTAEVIGEKTISTTKAVRSVDKCNGNIPIEEFKSSKITISNASSKLAIIGNLELVDSNGKAEKFTLTGKLIKRTFLGVEMNAIITAGGKALVFKKVDVENGAKDVVEKIGGPVISTIFTTGVEILKSTNVDTEVAKSLDQLYFVSALDLVKLSTATQGEEQAKEENNTQCIFTLLSADLTDRRKMIDFLYENLTINIGDETNLPTE